MNRQFDNLTSGFYQLSHATLFRTFLATLANRPEICLRLLVIGVNGLPALRQHLHSGFDGLYRLVLPTEPCDHTLCVKVTSVFWDSGQVVKLNYEGEHPAKPLKYGLFYVFGVCSLRIGYPEPWAGGYH